MVITWKLGYVSDILLMNLFLRNVVIYIILLVSVAVAPLAAFGLDASHYAAHSVLSSGRWVKVSVTETGIHFISNAKLAEWGFANPATVKIFGYGGAPISTTLDENQIDDLEKQIVLKKDWHLSRSLLRRRKKTDKNASFWSIFSFLG